MIILVSGATKTLDKYAGHKNIGQLMDPQSANKYRTDMPVAVDNAAYSDWDERKFIRLIDSIVGKSVLFVAAPDVVGDAIATSRLYSRWWEEIKQKRGLPTALVLQDGQEWIGLPPPWKYDAIFIGGTTGFKLGKYARYCVSVAKQRGKHVHMGRVNSFRRIEYAMSIGCDSVDGTGFSIEPDGKIKKFISHIGRFKQQTVMFEDGL